MNRSASSKGRAESRSRSCSPEGRPSDKAHRGKSSRPLFNKERLRLSSDNMSPAAKVVGCLRNNVLTILNILGVFTGVVVALILRNSREEKWTQREIVYVGFVGKCRRRHLFLQFQLPRCCAASKQCVMCAMKATRETETSIPLLLFVDGYSLFM